MADISRLLRRAGLSVRSRKSKVKGLTMGQARKAIAKLGEPEGTFFTIGVPGHALLVDHKGRTVVDTAPRKRDRRKVDHCSIVVGHAERVAKRRASMRDWDLKNGIPAKWAGKTLGEIPDDEVDEFAAWIRAERRRRAWENQVERAS